MTEIEVWALNRHEHEAVPIGKPRKWDGEPFVPKIIYDTATGILADMILLSLRGEITFHGSEAVEVWARAKALVLK